MPALKNAKHETYAREVAAGKTQTEAAILAGYAPVSAATHTTRLAKKCEIKARIEELQERVAVKAEWNAAKVLIRLGEIADANIAEIYDAAGRLKPVAEWPAYWQRVAERIESTQKFERSRDGGDKSWDPAAELLKIHMPDRLRALELIGRHKAVDAFVAKEEKHEHYHLHVNLQERLAAGRERLRLVPQNTPKIEEKAG